MSQDLHSIYGQFCRREHAPKNVEQHARERLEEIDKRIPELEKELAAAVVEKRRIQKMLEAIGG